MRKNGIDRELRHVDGGICAPKGFLANAVSCGINKEEAEKEDFGLIFSEKRASSACVYSTCGVVGAPIEITKLYQQRMAGFSRAIVFNGEVANVFQKDGKKVAEGICRLVERNTIALKEEVAIASTGRIDQEVKLEPFERKIQELIAGLNHSEENSEKLARALTCADARGKQLSFEFDLGAYPCRIGAVFKGNTKTCPNLATFLCFITTDANISPKMLQKALDTEIRDSFNLLDVDGQPSPNDMVCILANGQAGNYRIDYPDSEYKKFTIALHLAAMEICKTIAKNETDKAIVCNVRGGKSKQTTRAIAKNIVGSQSVKETFTKQKLDLEGILFAIVGTGTEVDFEQVQISIGNEDDRIVVWEEGKALFIEPQAIERALHEDEVELFVDLGEGNYSSTAIGRSFSTVNNGKN